MTKGAPYVLSVESLATFNVTAHDDVPIVGFSCSSATVGQVTEEGSPSETLDKPSLVGKCPEVERSTG